MAHKSYFTNKLLEDLRLRKRRSASGQNHSSAATGLSHENKDYTLIESGNKDQSSHNAVGRRTKRIPGNAPAEFSPVSPNGSSKAMVSYQRPTTPSTSFSDLSVAIEILTSKIANSAQREFLIGTNTLTGTNTLVSKHVRSNSIDFCGKDLFYLREEERSYAHTSIAHTENQDTMWGNSDNGKFIYRCSRENDSLQVGLQLLRGATELQESLHMLRKLQEASHLMINVKPSIESKSLLLVQRESIHANVTSQRLTPSACSSISPERERGRSTTRNHERLQGIEQCKRRGLSPVARLMGLEEIPPESDPHQSMAADPGHKNELMVLGKLKSIKSPTTDISGINSPLSENVVTVGRHSMHRRAASWNEEREVDVHTDGGKHNTNKVVEFEMQRSKSKIKIRSKSCERSSKECVRHPTMAVEENAKLANNTNKHVKKLKDESKPENASSKHVSVAREESKYVTSENVMHVRVDGTSGGKNCKVFEIRSEERSANNMNIESSPSKNRLRATNIENQLAVTEMKTEKHDIVILTSESKSVMNTEHVTIHAPQVLKDQHKTPRDVAGQVVKDFKGKERKPAISVSDKPRLQSGPDEVPSEGLLESVRSSESTIVPPGNQLSMLRPPPGRKAEHKPVIPKSKLHDDLSQDCRDKSKSPTSAIREELAARSEETKYQQSPQLEHEKVCKPQVPKVETDMISTNTESKMRDPVSISSQLSSQEARNKNFPSKRSRLISAQEKKKTVTLTKQENQLKEILLSNPNFVLTARELFSIQISMRIATPSTEIHGKLILDCALELMKRKHEFEQRNCRIVSSASKIKCVDDLVKVLHEDMNHMNDKELKSDFPGSTDFATMDLLNEIVKSDIHSQCKTSAWDVDWNENLVVGFEKDMIVKELEKHVFNGLLEETIALIVYTT